MTVKVDELQTLLQKVGKEKQHLEEKYQKKKLKCKQRKEVLVHTNCQNNAMTKKVEELQVDLKQKLTEYKSLEEKYQNIMSDNTRKNLHTETKAEFELAISKLQSQLRQAEEEHKRIEKELQDEVDVLQNRSKESEQLVDELRLKLKLLEEENKYAREIDISKQNTRDKLNQEITELQVQLNLVEEEKADLERKHLNEILTREELNRAAEELKHQLKQVEHDNKCGEQKYQQELSKHRETCEERDKARCENQTLIEQLQDFKEQRENEMLMKDLQIQQLQTNEKKLKEDLLTQEHAKAENTLHIQNLRDELCSCRVFMGHLLDTQDQLSDKLSNTDKFHREREKRYVKLVNTHIQKQNEARRKVVEMKKLSWPQKLGSWWNKKIHKTKSSWEEESIYPDDWRLPDIGDF